jgi:hypothetical protein
VKHQQSITPEGVTLNSLPASTKLTFQYNEEHKEQQQNMGKAMNTDLRYRKFYKSFVFFVPFVV